MVEIADFDTSLWHPAEGYQERKGTARWVPASGDLLDYFEEGEAGWKARSAADRVDIARTQAFRDLGPAYKQFTKAQAVHLSLVLCAPAAAEGVTAYAIELAYDAAGLPNIKHVWQVGKTGLRYLNPKNWRFASGRLYSGVPLPEFVGDGANKLRRFNGPKPRYVENPAHVAGRGLRPGKTPLPPDAEEVFRNAVPNDRKNPTAWFGRSANGQTYRFSVDPNGTAHFSGIDEVGDGTRNLTPYARARMEEQAL